MKRVRKGMTLIEIMITIAILSSVMVSTLMAVTQGQEMLAQSREEALAVQAAGVTMANLKAGDFSGFILLPSDFFSDFNSIVSPRLDDLATATELAAADGLTPGFEPQLPRFPSGKAMLKAHVDENGDTLYLGEVSVVSDGNLWSVRVTIQWRGDSPKFKRSATLVAKVAQ